MSHLGSHRSLHTIFWSFLNAAALLLCAVCVCAQPVKPNAPAKPTAQMTAADKSALERALHAYDNGQTKEAEPALRALAHKYPDSYPANEALGSLYAEAGDIAGALPFLRRSCNIAPAEAVAHANLGAAYLKLGKKDDAVQELRLAAKLQPNNAQTQSTLGQALMAKGQPAEAAKVFGSAAAADAANPDLLYNWAVALFDSGRAADAATVVARIPADAASDQTESLAGDIDEKLGRYQSAAVHLERAAQLNPSEPNLYALSIELLRHWTWETATKVSDFGVSKYPESTRLQLAAGIARYGSNQYAEAAQIFSRLLAADPENASYADLLGRNCSLLAEGSTAGCNGLEHFADTHPDNAQAAVYAAASILHRPAAEQDAGKAERLLKQALAANPNLPDAHYELAVLEQQRNNWQASAGLLEKAVALKPAYAEAHYRLARAYSHVGRRDDAQKQIALQQQYSQQEKDSLNAKLKEVTTFLVTTH